MKTTLEELYQTNYQRIFCYHIRSTNNIHDAEDLAHDTFEKALRTVGSFLEHPQPLAWLYAIARSVRTDAFRRAASALPCVRIDEALDSSQPNTVEDIILPRADLEEVLAIIATFKPKDQAVCYRRLRMEEHANNAEKERFRRAKNRIVHILAMRRNIERNKKHG